MLIFPAAICSADTNSGLPPLPPIQAPNLAQTQPNAPAQPAPPPQSELEKYKSQFKQVIGSHWYPKINTQNILLSTGKIKVQCVIRFDGTVTAQVVKGAKPSTMLLQTSSLDAIHQSSPLPPFSDSLRKQIGDSLTYTLTFVINDKAVGTIK